MARQANSTRGSVHQCDTLGLHSAEVPENSKIGQMYGIFQVSENMIAQNALSD
jgi:hypothetical protein